MRRNTIMSTLTSTVTCAIALTLGAGSAAASTGDLRPPGASVDRATDAQVRAALTDAASGRISAADEALILSRPDVAAKLIDVDSGTWHTERDETKVIRPLDLATGTAAAIKSRFVDRYISYTTWYGGAALKYHFTVQWRYNGQKVTSTPIRGHYAVINGPGIIDHGLTENTASPVGSQPYAYRVSMQGHVEQCILKFGCFTSVDPYTRFGVYFDGTYTIYQRK
jgi:hypothetical protein